MRRGKYYDEELGCYVNKNGERVGQKSKKKAGRFLTICIVLAIVVFALGIVVSVVMRSDLGMGVGSTVGVLLFFTGVIGGAIMSPDEPKKKESYMSDLELQDRAKRSAEWDKRMKDLEDAQLRDDVRRIREFLDD